MNSAYLLLGALAGLILAGSCSDREPKIDRREITKEISVSDKNGRKKVTVTTTENGKTTTATYTGKEAEDKLIELEWGADVNITVHSDSKSPADILRSMTMEDNDGAKTLTVVTVENGQTTTATYTGDEADSKLKELEQHTPKAEQGKTVEQTVKVRRIKSKEH